MCHNEYNQSIAQNITLSLKSFRTSSNKRDLLYSDLDQCLEIRGQVHRHFMRAFQSADPESPKRQSRHQYLFALLGSALIKAVRKCWWYRPLLSMSGYKFLRRIWRLRSEYFSDNASRLSLASTIVTGAINGWNLVFCTNHSSCNLWRSRNSIHSLILYTNQLKFKYRWKQGLIWIIIYLTSKEFNIPS